jgi:hypothetical protein
MSKYPYGTLMILTGRTDERAAEKPIYMCMNCGCSILPSEGLVRWVKWRPGFWLSDSDGPEHVNRRLCERQRKEGEEHAAAARRSP